MSTLKNITVKNMTLSNGNDIPNQFIITTPKARIFQSYKSVIAKIEGGKVTLDRTYWNYSTTTGKYRNQFLREDKKTTERKIKSGEYRLGNLN